MKNWKYYLLIILLIGLSFFLQWIFSSSKQSNPKGKDFSVNLTYTIDPDIILVNIGNADRISVAKQLLKIDSCQPALIAVDTYFPDEKGNAQDSDLMNALQKIPNDVLSYFIDSNNNVLKSHRKFEVLAKDEGLAFVTVVNGLSSQCTPIEVIDGTQHELFSLRQWKPDFKTTFKPDQTINTNFTRTLDEYVHIEGTDLANIDCNYFKNKVILLGYLGPDDIDKHFTPIRFVKDYPENKADTYGLVIIANQIRTILEYR
jgi:CHASE2 domain-containing sensor protein